MIFLGRSLQLLSFKVNLFSMTKQIITNRREMKAHLEGFIFKDVCFIQVILGRIKSVSRDLSLVSLHFLPILNQWLKVLGGLHVKYLWHPTYSIV